MDIHTVYREIENQKEKYEDNHQEAKSYIRCLLNAFYIDAWRNRFINDRQKKKLCEMTKEGKEVEAMERYLEIQKVPLEQRSIFDE